MIKNRKEQMYTCDSSAEVLLTNSTRCLPNQVLHITEIRQAPTISSFYVTHIHRKMWSVLKFDSQFCNSQKLLCTNKSKRPL